MPGPRSYLLQLFMERREFKIASALTFFSGLLTYSGSFTIPHKFVNSLMDLYTTTCCVLAAFVLCLLTVLGTVPSSQL